NDLQRCLDGGVPLVISEQLSPKIGRSLQGVGSRSKAERERSRRVVVGRRLIPEDPGRERRCLDVRNGTMKKRPTVRILAAARILLPCFDVSHVVLCHETPPLDAFVLTACPNARPPPVGACSREHTPFQSSPSHYTTCVEQARLASTPSVTFATRPIPCCAQRLVVGGASLPRVS